MKVNKIRSTNTAIVMSLILLSFNAWAGDVTKGKEKSKLCEGCHGTNGISVSSIIPNLAGQKAEYLTLSLQAFKNGSRKNGIMSSIVAQISADDISDLSTYYSSLTIENIEAPQ